MVENLYNIGLLIYQCEGSKKTKNRIVEIVNSDPKIIKIFLKFLKLLHVPNEKLRGRISIHEGQNIQKITKYWSELTGIPENQFQKPIIKKQNIHFKKGKKGRLNNGTFIIRVNSSSLHKKIISEGSKYLDALINYRLGSWSSSV